MAYVDLGLRKDRVTLRTPWDPSIPALAKQIPGASWSATRLEWSYPLAMHTLHELRDTFGDRIRSSPELTAWAKDEVRKGKRLKSLATVHNAPTPEVDRLAPALSTAMASRTYQRSGARFMARAGSGIIADEPGLGKTAQALAALMEARAWEGDHLIIAPKSSLSSVWDRQIRMWTPSRESVAFPEGAAARRKALDEFWDLEDSPRFLIVNPDVVRRKYGHYCKKCNVWEEDVKARKLDWPKKHFMEGHGIRPLPRKVYSEDWPEILNHNWKSVILDESHQILANYTPSNLKNNQKLQGLLDLKSEHRFGLTGTPLRGQETRTWGTIDWVSFGRYGGYWNFVDSFFDVANNGFGKEIRGLADDRRVEFGAMVDRFYLRRTRAEVRPDLPLGQRVDVLVEMPPAHRKQYERFEQEGEIALESGAISGLGTLSELTRLKQFAFGIWDKRPDGSLYATTKSPVLDWLYDWLSARGVTGTKVGDWFPEPGVGYKYVVASQSTEVLDAVRRGLDTRKIPSVTIAGATKGSERTRINGQFQSDDTSIRVLLIQTITGGVSIELDAWCDEMVILDETYVADDQVQLEGRINNRSGRVAPRMWHYVRVADTIQQKIAESNYNQHVLQHNLLDARRGVQTALHLIRS